MQISDFVENQKSFSEKTFGPGQRTNGIIEHIRRELKEIELNPKDIYEFCDVVILALDLAWRAGHTPDEIEAALIDKQSENILRSWPDWRKFSQDELIEHERTTLQTNRKSSKFANVSEVIVNKKKTCK